MPTIPRGIQEVTWKNKHSKGTQCLVPCDFAPKRSWPLLRAKIILDGLFRESATATDGGKGATCCERSDPLTLKGK